VKNNTRVNDLSAQFARNNYCIASLYSIIIIIIIIIIILIVLSSTHCNACLDNYVRQAM